jgi:two-component system phosphate regulon sensor histidine kinase PhoR
LISLLAIQVNWIFKTAKIKEALFNEKANMVLAKTIEDVSQDKEMCQKIEACSDSNTTTNTSANLGKTETSKIDSLFRRHMREYNIQIDYTFVIAKPAFILADQNLGFAKSILNNPTEKAISADGLELKLIFPDKKKFILAEMGGMFIASIVLILIVLLLFWRTVLSLLKEKKISEHTAEFLNNMTHEFKTPLTNIALAGKMMTREANIQQEDKIKHYSGIILEENEKLRLQVEQVLSMTALERGEIPLHKTNIPFHELIEQAVYSMHLQLENKQGKIQLELNAASTNTLGDYNHLTNVLTNLIDNSIKYTQDAPIITIKTENKQDQLVITLSDNGIGIDKEFHKSVFDKFYRVPTGDVHNVKGFGLGLAYSKTMVEMHGGTLTMQSEIGKGTTFTLILPCE